MSKNPTPIAKTIDWGKVDWDKQLLDHGYEIWALRGNKTNNENALICIHGLGTQPYVFNSIINHLEKDDCNVYSIGYPSEKFPDLLQKVKDPGVKESSHVITNIIKDHVAEKNRYVVGASQGAAIARMIDINEDLKEHLKGQFLIESPNEGANTKIWGISTSPLKDQLRDVTKGSVFLKNLNASNAKSPTFVIFSDTGEVVRPKSALAVRAEKTLRVSGINPETDPELLGDAVTAQKSGPINRVGKSFYLNGENVDDIKWPKHVPGSHIGLLKAGSKPIAEFINSCMQSIEQTQGTSAQQPSHSDGKIEWNPKDGVEEHPGDITFTQIHKGNGKDAVRLWSGFGGTRKLWEKHVEDFLGKLKPEARPDIYYCHYPHHKAPWRWDPSNTEVIKNARNAAESSDFFKDKTIHDWAQSQGQLIVNGMLNTSPIIREQTKDGCIEAVTAPHQGVALSKNIKAREISGPVDLLKFLNPLKLKTQIKQMSKGSRFLEELSSRITSDNNFGELSIYNYNVNHDKFINSSDRNPAGGEQIRHNFSDGLVARITRFRGIDGNHRRSIQSGELVPDFAKHYAESRLNRGYPQSQISTHSPQTKSEQNGIETMIWPLNKFHEYQTMIKTGIDTINESRSDSDKIPYFKNKKSLEEFLRKPQEQDLVCGVVKIGFPLGPVDFPHHCAIAIGKKENGNKFFVATDAVRYGDDRLPKKIFGKEMKFGNAGNKWIFGLDNAAQGAAKRFADIAKSTNVTGSMCALGTQYSDDECGKFSALQAIALAEHKSAIDVFKSDIDPNLVIKSFENKGFSVVSPKIFYQNSYGQPLLKELLQDCQSTKTLENFINIYPDLDLTKEKTSIAEKWSDRTSPKPNPTYLDRTLENEATKTRSRVDSNSTTIKETESKITQRPEQLDPMSVAGPSESDLTNARLNSRDTSELNRNASAPSFTVLTYLGPRDNPSDFVLQYNTGEIKNIKKANNEEYQEALTYLKNETQIRESSQVYRR